MQEISPQELQNRINILTQALQKVMNSPNPDNNLASQLKEDIQYFNDLQKEKVSTQAESNNEQLSQ